MYILTSATGLSVLAMLGIVGGSIIATPDFESPLPKPEPVSFVSTVEAKCPGLGISPKWNYHSSCLGRVVMEYTDIGD